MWYISHIRYPILLGSVSTQWISNSVCVYLAALRHNDTFLCLVAVKGLKQTDLYTVSYCNRLYINTYNLSQNYLCLQFCLLLLPIYSLLVL